MDFITCQRAYGGRSNYSVNGEEENSRFSSGSSNYTKHVSNDYDTGRTKLKSEMYFSVNVSYKRKLINDIVNKLLNIQIRIDAHNNCLGFISIIESSVYLYWTDMTWRKCSSQCCMILLSIYYWPNTAIELLHCHSTNCQLPFCLPAQ